LYLGSGNGDLGTEITATAAELNIMDGVTATAAELNAAADVSAQDVMAGSTVIEATVETYVSKVVKQGGIIKTEILVDLTGAKSTTTENDIIGDTGACHFGQITTAINGVIQAGKVSCLELPAGGVTDIDFAQASVATGAYDADVTGLTNYGSLIASGGAWALGTEKYLDTITANYYLYLASGAAGTAAPYTAGKFLIELWGI
jgi:hypothetical protein